jgi:hypothetical protein
MLTVKSPQEERNKFDAVLSSTGQDRSTAAGSDEMLPSSMASPYNVE